MTSPPLPCGGTLRGSHLPPSSPCLSFLASKPPSGPAPAPRPSGHVPPGAWRGPTQGLRLQEANLEGAGPVFHHAAPTS